MLGNTLVTKQSGAAGRMVRRLYIEDGSAIARELYLSALVDRATGRVAFIASAEGGMDIEEVAATAPEKIVTVHVDPAAGYSPHIGTTIAYALGLSGNAVKQCISLVGTLYAAMLAKDMSQLEINPLVVTRGGRSSLPRRQDQFRRQRAVPSPRRRRAARSRRGGPARGRGGQALPGTR